MTNSDIIDVRGRRVWDSRGRPTVEAEVILSGGATGRAIAPAGASTGSGEAVDLRDGGSRFGGYDVQRAVTNVNGAIRDAIRGMDAHDQSAIDGAMVTLDGTANKMHLGGNAMVAVSMANLHAAAAEENKPLWRYLGGDATTMLPLPEIQIFGGGAHAGSRVDVQDFMVVAPGARSFDEALAWTAEVYRAAGNIMADMGKRQGVADEGGFWPAFDSNEQALETLVHAIEAAGYVPGEQVAITLDIAATEFGKDRRYRLALEDRELDSDGLCDMLSGWLDRYPIVSIEDPLGEDDPAGMRAFTQANGHRVQIVGDDYVVTDAQRIAGAAMDGACNCALIKPNQAGTVTETQAAVQAARKAGWGTIVSARSGETEDVTIVHLAVGWGVAQLKVGSFSRSERMAKWNEALRVEEDLGNSAEFAGWTPYKAFRPATG